MKKYKIRFYGFGITGITKMPFNTEPTIEMIEDTLALHMNEGLAKIESDTFFSATRFTIAYEEDSNNTKKEKENILGTWI